MEDKELYYRVSESAILRPLLRNPVFALGVHWVFQGMLYMDRTELLFKLGVDLVLSAISWILLYWGLGVSWAWATVAAMLVAHTLNFLFNGQVWVVAKHFRRVSHSRLEFEDRLARLSDRIRVEPSIQWAAAYGSLARGEWRQHSDLDVRLVRKSGLWNGLRACWFALCERTRALVSRFPLDLFVLDDPRRLARMRDDEPPIFLGCECPLDNSRREPRLDWHAEQTLPAMASLFTGLFASQQGANLKRPQR